MSRKEIKTRALITGIAALSLLPGTAHADCCDMGKFTPAGRAFDVAAKRHFGRAVSKVAIWEEENRPDMPLAAMIIKDRRYLGVPKDKNYLVCRYQTKPVVRFFNCFAWEGD